MVRVNTLGQHGWSFLTSLPVACVAHAVGPCRTTFTLFSIPDPTRRLPSPPRAPSTPCVWLMLLLTTSLQLLFSLRCKSPLSSWMRLLASRFPCHTILTRICPVCSRSATGQAEGEQAVDAGAPSKVSGCLRACQHRLVRSCTQCECDRCSLRGL